MVPEDRKASAAPLAVNVEYIWIVCGYIIDVEKWRKGMHSVKRKSYEKTMTVVLTAVAAVDSTRVLAWTVISLTTAAIIISITTAAPTTATRGQTIH